MFALHHKRLSILLVLILTACSNSSLNPTPTVDLSGLPTITAAPSTVEAEIGQSAEPTFASAVTHEPSGLKVVFISKGNVWFWSETSPASQLTSDGDAAQVKLSSDGKVVAFQRAQSIWAVNSDGANLRQLADASILTGQPYLAQFEFQPNTHYVYFTSRDSIRSPIGQNLLRVNADAPTVQPLLTEGGYLTFSSDGSMLALAQPARINIFRPDSISLVSAFDYKKVNTNADWDYIPQVVWLDDSSGFYTVIPGTNADDKTRFLFVSANGEFTAQLAEFVMADIRVAQPIIAPNGSKVAYVTKKDSTFDIHVIDASTADAIVASYTDPLLIGLWAWSPDSERIIYHTGDPSRLLIAGLRLPSVPLLIDNIVPYTLRWVDADRFIYIANGELRLGQFGVPTLSVIASGFSSAQVNGQYDFAQ